MKRCPTCNRIETDDALAFCRVDGATLAVDSSSIAREAGTAQLSSQSDLSEVHTSILPHNTNANIDRATVATTVLPTPPAITGALARPGKRKAAIIVALITAAVFAVAAAFIANSYLSRRSAATIERTRPSPRWRLGTSNTIGGWPPSLRRSR
jgi:hypothetical protein